METPAADHKTPAVLPLVRGDHPVLNLPFTVGIDGRNHTGRGLSLVSADVSGLIDPALEGAVRLVRLLFSFNGFTVALSLRARLQGVDQATGHATLVFLEPAGEHLPQLRHILNSYIAGDLVSLGETIGVSASAPLPASRQAPNRRGVMGRLLGATGMGLATLALLTFAVGAFVTRTYATALDLPGSVERDGSALTAIAAGQIDYVNPNASVGEVAFALRATSGETLSIAMPCNCDARLAGPEAGATVLAGEPVMILNKDGAGLIVTTSVTREDLARLGFADHVLLTFRDGATARAAIDPASLQRPASGTDAIPLRLIPEVPLPDDRAGQLARLTVVQPMPEFLKPLVQLLPSFAN